MVGYINMSWWIHLIYLPISFMGALRWSWWRHEMETISALLALCEWNPSMDSLQKGPVIRIFDVSLMLVWTNCWTNTRVAGDVTHQGPMWRHCNEYDCPMTIVVTAMRDKLVGPKTQQNTTEHGKTWTPSIILRVYFIQGQPLFSSSKTLPILIQIQRNSSTTLWRDDRHH